MIFQKMLAKVIFKSVYKALKRKHDLKRIEKYVVMENELDKEVKKLKERMGKHTKYIEDLYSKISKEKGDK